ncbi:hypothetical protein ACIPY6_07025 [Streptomyces sp. NPDC090054]|uniref:hypothetical protein n=1 Tax=Streptomyces sp. NPDC090054 TaxID=3365933 RepID=UPI0037F1E06C
MNTAKRIAATCAAVLLTTLALGGAAHADGQGGGQGGGAVKAPYERTVKAAPGTDGVAARKVRPASKDAARPDGQGRSGNRPRTGRQGAARVAGRFAQ